MRPLSRVSLFFVRSYEGEWVDGKINGQGTLWYADGDQYQGEWRDGKMHGRGTYTYADGDQYEGDWRDDRRHGKGTVVYAAIDGTSCWRLEATPSPVPSPLPAPWTSTSLTPFTP